MGSTEANYVFNSDGSGFVTFTGNNQIEKFTQKKDTSNKYLVVYENPAILKGRSGYLIYENGRLIDSQGFRLTRLYQQGEPNRFWGTSASF